MNKNEALETPISRPLRRSETDPTWIQVIKLFQQHGMPEPPFRLRDELVCAFEWAWYGERRAALSEPAKAVGVKDRLFDDAMPMADGGEEQMTAAEEVLAWLIIEKIGVPDDVGYTPKQAQEIISRRLDLVRELEKIDEMLCECQGDDQGPSILPEFSKGMTTYAKVEACLHLLERRRDVISSALATDKV